MSKNTANFGRRLRMLMLENGFDLNGKPNQSALSRATGLSQTQISRYLSDRHTPGADNLERIARALGVSAGVLVGDVPMVDGLKPILSVGRICPVMSWEELTLAEIRSKKNQDRYKQWMECPVKCGGDTFVLTVGNEAMVPDFRDGDYVFVDPDADIQSGDFVVAIPDGQDRGILRKFVVDGNDNWLISSDRNWHSPTLPISSRDNLLGKVVFSGRAHI
jgi:SOS-response transcriptional repressor LexA